MFIVRFVGVEFNVVIVLVCFDYWVWWVGWVGVDLFGELVVI